MSFLNPMALVTALLALPIVAFYLLKTRPRRVPVATVMFWQQAFEEKKHRRLWRQFRHLLSLLLQLALLTLLVFAVADPVFDATNQKQRRIVVVIDASASMQALHADGGARMNAAQLKVADLISSLRATDEMAIITAGRRPQVVSGLTSHFPTLARLAKSISTIDGPADVEAAIDVGRRLLADHSNSRLVVVSDGCIQNAAELAADTSIEWLQTGESIGNVGITQFQVRRNLSDPLGYQLLIEVRNQSDQPAACSVEFEFDGGLSDVIPLELQPNEVWNRVLEQTSTGGGVLTARLAFDSTEIQSSTANALPVDDVAQCVLPARARIPVTLVTDGNWFLQQVLEANSLVDLSVTDKLPDSVPPDEILVLHRSVPGTLPAGRVLAVQPTASTNLWEWKSVLKNPLVGSQDDSSELLRHVRLDNVMMPQAAEIRPLEEHDVLIETVSGAPLYVRFSRDEGDVLVLLIDLETSDLPLRTAFPILLSNALTTLSEQSGQLNDGASSGVVEFGAAARAAESDLRPQISADRGTLQTATAASGRPVWMYLTLAAIIFAIAEWSLFHRRWVS